MSNVDSLLDLGDTGGEVSAPPPTLSPSDPTPSQGATDDPFDIFGTPATTTSTSDAQAPASAAKDPFGDFDPFGAPPVASSGEPIMMAEPATNGDLLGGTNGQLSEQEAKKFESQFDDLLGGLGDTPSGQPLLDLASSNTNGEVTVTTEKTSMDIGGDVIVTSQTDVMTSSADDKTSTSTTVVTESNEGGWASPLIEASPASTSTTVVTESNEGGWASPLIEASPAVDIQSSQASNIDNESQKASSDGRASPATSDGGKMSDKDKKAMEYMKERYEQEKEVQQKVIREPKKLDQRLDLKYNPEEAEKDLEQSGKDHKRLPQEQDLIAYRTVGTDYSKQKYQCKVDEEAEKAKLLPADKQAGQQWEINNPKSPDERQGPIVVNRQVVEKVAPPEITKNIKNLFESGGSNDAQRIIKKIDAKHDRPAEGGVYESDPTQRTDVTRETDVMEDGVVTVEQGTAKSLRERFSNYGKNDQPKERVPIKLWDEVDGGASVLENEPEDRDENVVRGGDEGPKQEALAAGHTKGLASRFLNAGNENGPKERKPIKLFEDGQDQAIVLESQPVQRDDVVREQDQNPQSVMVEAGKIRNIAGVWGRGSEEKVKERTPIIIDRNSEATVLESQPIVRDDVCRESDQADGGNQAQIERGSSKKLKERFLTQNGDAAPKERREQIQIDRSQGAGVFESQPVVLEGVVREGEGSDEVIATESGRTKQMASGFLKTEEDTWKPKVPILIERSGQPSVAENQPIERDDVVKSDSKLQAVTVESGRCKNMVGHWKQTDEDRSTVKTSTMGPDGKPRWVMEIEAAKESGVFENEPEVREDGIIREEDSHANPEAPQALIPNEYAKNMKSMWNQREAELEAEANAHKADQLIRFTPPREMTPPRVHQTMMQSKTVFTFGQPGTGQQPQQVNQNMIEKAPAPQGYVPLSPDQAPATGYPLSQDMINQGTILRMNSIES